MTTTGTRTRARPATLRVLALLIGLGAAALLTELVFRVILFVEDGSSCEGTCFKSELNARWGWGLRPGPYRLTTSEFDSRGVVNELYMNDGRPFDARAEADATRILALGDSHTAAVGVSGSETWVAQLERRLDETQGPGRFVCHNAAAPGYSLHQYLTRLLDQGAAVAPHYVIVGFSYATDLFDLLPPDRGGWIYGPEMARVYWDLDHGELVEKYWAPDGPSTLERAPKTLSASLRAFLDHFATFRYLKRSPLALAIGARFRPGGQTLWPNMEIVLEREASPEHRYQWELSLALLRKLDEEARRLGAKLIVVGIPYLPQVYDEIWEATFGGDARYNPTAAPERLSRLLEVQGIAYVETLDAMREVARERGRWLHHRRDGHPTAEGQAVIAEAVLDAHLVEPRAGEGAPAHR